MARITSRGNYRTGATTTQRITPRGSYHNPVVVAAGSSFVKLTGRPQSLAGNGGGLAG